MYLEEMKRGISQENVGPEYKNLARRLQVSKLSAENFFLTVHYVGWYVARKSFAECINMTLDVSFMIRLADWLTII